MKKNQLHKLIPLFLFIFIASFLVKSLHSFYHHANERHFDMVQEQLTKDAHPQCTIEEFVFYYFFTWEPVDYNYYVDLVQSIVDDIELPIYFIKVFSLYDLRAPPVYFFY